MLFPRHSHRERLFPLHFHRGRLFPLHLQTLTSLRLGSQSRRLGSQGHHLRGPATGVPGPSDLTSSRASLLQAVRVQVLVSIRPCAPCRTYTRYSRPATKCTPQSPSPPPFVAGETRLPRSLPHRAHAHGGDSPEPVGLESLDHAKESALGGLQAGLRGRRRGARAGDRGGGQRAKRRRQSQAGRLRPHALPAAEARETAESESQHRDVWPCAGVNAGGASSRHRSNARRQRG